MASKATTRERYGDFNVEVSSHNLGLPPDHGVVGCLGGGRQAVRRRHVPALDRTGGLCTIATVIRLQSRRIRELGDEPANS